MSQPELTKIPTPEAEIIGYDSAMPQNIIEKIVVAVCAIHSYEPMASAVSTTKKLLTKEKTSLEVTLRKDSSCFYSFNTNEEHREQTPLLGQRLVAWFIFGPEAELFTGVVWDGVIAPKAYATPGHWCTLNKSARNRQFTWGVPKYGAIVHITPSEMEVDIYNITPIQH